MCCMLNTFHVSSWIVANVSESYIPSPLTIALEVLRGGGGGGGSYQKITVPILFFKIWAIWRPTNVIRSYFIYSKCGVWKLKCCVWVWSIKPNNRLLLLYCAATMAAECSHCGDMILCTWSVNGNSRSQACNIITVLEYHHSIHWEIMIICERRFGKIICICIGHAMVYNNNDDNDW